MEEFLGMLQMDEKKKLTDSIQLIEVMDFMEIGVLFKRSPYKLQKRTGFNAICSSTSMLMWLYV